MTAVRARRAQLPWDRVALLARGLAPPAAFVLSLALYATLSLIAPRPPYHPVIALHFFDLEVYRASAGVVVRGAALYRAQFGFNLGFTYPPFAALAMVPLRLLSLRGDELLVTAVNVGLLVGIAWWSLGLRRDGDRPVPAGRGRWTVAWIAAAVGLWCEPINSALGYGQIDVLIAALVLADLCRGERRGAGTGIGLAAGLKLTPLIFIPYLLLAGRVRAARNATLTFAATIIVGAIALPGDSRAYWWDAGFADTSRVSGARHAGGGPSDQSLRGALLRVAPGLGEHTDVWLSLAVLTACAGLALAVLAARRGDAAQGFVLTAITGLLVSPISWTHEWTLAMPALLLLVVAPGRSRRATALVAAGVLAFTALSYELWPLIVARPGSLHLDFDGELIANLYVLAGLATLLAAAIGEVTRRRRRSGQEGSPVVDDVGDARLDIVVRTSSRSQRCAGSASLRGCHAIT